MDNVKFHQGEYVKEVIENHALKHIRTFIPKYSPHLNAIEYCFGQWVWFVNRHERNTESQLKELIEKAALATTIQDCQGWHHEVTRYHVLCASGEPLRYQPPQPKRSYSAQARLG